MDNRYFWVKQNFTFSRGGSTLRRYYAHHVYEWSPHDPSPEDTAVKFMIFAPT